MFPSTLSFHPALFLLTQWTESGQEQSRRLRLLWFPQGPFHTALVIKGGLSFHTPPPSHPIKPLSEIF